MHLSRSEGFTLVELLVALLMLSIGLLSVGRMFVFSTRHAYYGRSETIATTLAEEIREKILSENFDDIVTIFDGVDTDVPETVTTPCQEWKAHLDAGLGPHGRGRIAVHTSAEDPEIVNGMWSVAITIDWAEGAQQRSVTLHFAVSQMGV